MARRPEVVSLIDAVTSDLRSRVITGDIAPGAPLAEVDIAQEYNVARPTAKAAIESLVHERLLVRAAHRTARVVRLTPDDVYDIYRSREIIEAQALRMLAQTRNVPLASRAANAEIVELVNASPQEVVEPDMRFHRGLIDALGSDRTSSLYGSLTSEVVFCMSQVQGASLLHTDEIAAEHAGILDRIDAGDGDGAAALLRGHLGRARERLAALLSDVASPPAPIGSRPVGARDPDA